MCEWSPRQTASVRGYRKSVMNGKFTFSEETPFAQNGGIGHVSIKISLEVLHDTCKYMYDEANCLKYLSIPTDSCDCSGINNKHGGKVINPCLQWRIDPQLIN